MGYNQRSHWGMVRAGGGVDRWPWANLGSSVGGRLLGIGGRRTVRVRKLASGRWWWMFKVVRGMTEAPRTYSPCPLAFTRGRVQGMGFRAWFCVIGRTRQDEEPSGSRCPGNSYQDHPQRPKRSKNSSESGKGAVKKGGYRKRGYRLIACNPLILMVGQDRIELSTHGFSVRSLYFHDPSQIIK